MPQVSLMVNGKQHSVEVENRTLLVANSGLPRPIHVHGGKNHVIEATGLPLGLFDDANYDEFRFKMKP